jgi:hypothetical protein
MSHENVEIVRAFVEAAGRDPKKEAATSPTISSSFRSVASTDRREDPLDQ